MLHLRKELRKKRKEENALRIAVEAEMRTCELQVKAASTSKGSILSLLQNLTKKRKRTICCFIYFIFFPNTVVSHYLELPRQTRFNVPVSIYFVEHNLDALFVLFDTSGRSAFNRVERRMVLLSKDLSGFILPHDHFSTRLSNSNETFHLCTPAEF